MAYTLLKQFSTNDIKGILFDLDGVILDTEKLYSRFWQEALKAYGYNISLEDVAGLRSLNNTLAKEYLEKLLNTKINYDEIHALRVNLMEEWIDKNGVEAKHGINELLDYLEENNIAYAITTSSPHDRIKKYLEKVNLYDRFNLIFSVKEVKMGKPYPDIYLYGAKMLNLEPNECLAIEDSENGILSAFRANTISVLIPDQDKPTNLALNSSYVLADRLNDVIELLKK